MKRWITRSIAAVSMLVATHSVSMAQDSSKAGNGISAGLIASELRAMGYTARVDKDESGDPRVNTKVDGFEWQVYFYDCGTGEPEQRNCDSFQFYSGYNVRNGFPLDTINKWNTEKRYAKAYTYVQRDKTNNARIEIDVRIADTGADPARAFRAYYTKMKSAAEGFRKAIGFSQ